MAATITKKFTLKGSKLFILHLSVVSDGAAGETTNGVLVDVSADLPGSEFKIQSLLWSLVGFSAKLDWDATANTHAFSLTDGSDDMCFLSKMGSSIVNNAGAGKTGDLLISTTGLGAGDHGVIIIKGEMA